MDIHAILFDIDGTLFIGPDPIPGAAETIRFLMDRNIPYRFVSNGTRKARRSVCEKLQRLMIPVSEEQIWTPAIAAVRYLKEKGYETCTLLSTDNLREDFISAGISVREDAPVLVIGDAAEHFTYAAMNAAFRQIMNGAQILALEKDRYWKDSDGLSLGAGPFVAGLEFSSGCRSILMGKPSPDFFRMALQSLGTEAHTTLMIGDDLNTDVRGAIASGLRGALVMTGKSSPDSPMTDGVKPDLILPSVASVPELFRSSS